jgi:transposase
MDARLKQRAVIEFLIKEGCSAVEIHRRLKDVYGDAVIDVSNVRRWVKKFRDGESEIADKPRSGRSSTSVTDNRRSRIDELIRENRRITIHKIADALQLFYGSVQAMIENLGYHKVCAKWVPRQLTPDLRHIRVEGCQELLIMFEVQKDTFFTNVVTGDETWAYLYDLESKNQSKDWWHTGSPHHKKF